MPVLSEIKVWSPRDGDLLRRRSPEALASAMGRCPIAGLSVVTEPRLFKGDLAIIRQVQPLVSVPILRKDFIQDEAQVEETAEAGATAMLLIVSMLETVRLGALHEEAHRCGLETVIEVHDEGDWSRLQASGVTPDILGINNRNILVGETDEDDVAVTERLARRLDRSSLVLSESSLSHPDDVVRARNAGADAVLVGTAILSAPDPEVLLRAMIAVGWSR